MTRKSCLEAVALAAKKYQETYSEVVVDAKFSTDAEDQANADAYNELFDALKALDGCPNQEEVKRPERPTRLVFHGSTDRPEDSNYVVKLEAYCDFLEGK